MSPRHLICSMFACAAFMAAPSIADAQEIKQAGNFGIGLGAGTYTSLLSMKYFLSSDLSLQGVVGPYRYGFYCNRGYYGRGCNGWRRNDALAVSLDVLSERGTIAGNGDLTLDWQIGGGVGLGILGGGTRCRPRRRFRPGPSAQHSRHPDRSRRRIQAKGAPRRFLLRLLGLHRTYPLLLLAPCSPYPLSSHPLSSSSG